MTTFFDFDEVFGDLRFDGEFMKNIQREFNQIEKMINSGKLKGKWDVRKIDEPERKGYVIRGRFWSDQPIEPFSPFEPLKPWRRRPMPKRPFEVPKTALKKTREPLTDVFEEDETVKIYIELPGEEKDDIQLNVTEGHAEVKAKNFHKVIDLPTRHVEFEKATANYKNGVLEVTIPKTKETLSEEKKKTIKIE